MCPPGAEFKGKEYSMSGKVVLPFAGAILTSILLPVFAARSGAGPESFKIDSVHSSALYRVKHMQVSFSWGRFDDVSGMVAWDAGNPESASFDVRIKTESIDSNNRKRDEHLKGPEFFDTKKFPTMTFKSSSVKKTGDNEYEVSGDFTLHGVTRPLTAKVEMTGAAKGMDGKPLVGFETTFEIKRSDFGMGKMVGPIADEVRIIVSLEAGHS
jgi:polyisoprenoid-binding protein YceI